MSKELEKLAKENKAGRPTAYSIEVADAICERIADGESLRAICKDEDKPSKSTVFRWLKSNEEFRDQYARAKAEMADSLFDDMLAIADNTDKDKDEDGRVDVDHINRQRIRIETRKWMAGKLKPKVYGERIDHTSSDGTMRPSIIRQIIVDSNISEDE